MNLQVLFDLKKKFVLIYSWDRAQVVQLRSLSPFTIIEETCNGKQCHEVDRLLETSWGVYIYFFTFFKFLEYMLQFEFKTGIMFSVRCTLIHNIIV